MVVHQLLRHTAIIEVVPMEGNSLQCAMVIAAGKQAQHRPFDKENADWENSGQIASF